MFGLLDGIMSDGTISVTTGFLKRRIFFVTRSGKRYDALLDHLQLLPKPKRGVSSLICSV